MKKVTLFLLFLAVYSFLLGQTPKVRLVADIPAGSYLRAAGAFPIRFTVYNASPQSPNMEPRLRTADICWSMDGGDTNTHTSVWQDRGMPPGGRSFEDSHDVLVEIAEPGIHTIKVWICSINEGEPDPDSTNNTLEFKFKVVQTSRLKNVLFESFRSAWHGDSPGIECGLNHILGSSNIFPVNLHEAGEAGDTTRLDSMETQYTAEMRKKFVPRASSVVPNAIVDRRKFPVADSGRFDYVLNEQISVSKAETLSRQFSPLEVALKHFYNPDTRKLIVRVTGKFLEDTKGKFKINCILTEDSVASEDSILVSTVPPVKKAVPRKGYAQKLDSSLIKTENCFWQYPPAPGKPVPPNNPMKNYFHNHVLREYLSGVDGAPFPKDSAAKDTVYMQEGDTFMREYTYYLPRQWKDKNITMIGFIEGVDYDLNYAGIFNAARQKIKISSMDAILVPRLGPYVQFRKETLIPFVLINNSKTTAIKSAVINWTIDDGSERVDTFLFSGTGLIPVVDTSGNNLVPDNMFTGFLSSPLRISDTEIHKLKVWISKINDTNDDADPRNSTHEFNVRSTAAIREKNVLFEKFTSAECEDCPNADCDLNYVLRWYKNVFPVNIHGGDSLENPLYSPFLAKYPASEYPKAMVDRRMYFGQRTHALDAYVAAQNAPASAKQYSPISVELSENAYDSTTRKWSVKVAATFFDDLAGTFAFNCVIVEDSIRAEGAGLAQKLGVQYYTNPKNCWFENQNPMQNYFHNHVQRALLGGVDGSPFATNETIAAGEKRTFDYEFEVPENWNPKQLSMIGFVEGTDTALAYTGVYNAQRQKLRFATSIPEAENFAQGIRLYPNPANQTATLKFTAARSSEVRISVINALGTLVHEATMPAFAGAPVDYQWNVQELPAGIYAVSIEMNGEKVTGKLLIQH